MGPETHDTQRQTPETPESRGILAKSAEFKKVLSFPIQASDEEWKKHLEEALSPPDAPTSSNVVNPTDTRLQFLAKERTSIMNDQANSDFLFGELLDESKGEPLEELLGAIVLTRVADLLNRKRTYESLAKEEKPRDASMLPLYLSIAASELTEDAVANLLPQLPDTNAKATFSKLRETVKAEKRLAAHLRQAGIENGDVARMLSKMPRETKQLVGTLVARAAPNSVYDILLLSYYLHESDDKMAAAMQFSTFLVAQGLTEVVLESAAGRMAILGTLPKNPYVITAAALAIVIGLDKAIGVDKIVSWAESHVDPAQWDMGGQVVDTVSGSKLFDDVGELGYMSGLRSVDPLADRQVFLRQKLQMNRGDGARVEYAHGILDWNEQVERMAVAAEKEGNPVQANLYRLEKIDRGDWADRQSVSFYGNVEKLRGLQSAFNQLSGSNVDLIDVVTQPRKDDVEFRRLLQTPMFTSDIRSKIDAIRDPEQRKNAPDTYDASIRLAQQIVQDVTLYVHLGVYDPRWTRPREALGESSIIPEAVEKGMIAQMKYRSLRRKVLDPGSYPQLDEKTFAENLARTYRRDRDPDPWPDMAQHPVDWFRRFQAFNGNADRRVVTDVDQYAVLPSFMRDIAAIAGDTPALKKALEPLIAAVEQNKETMTPHDIKLAVLTALADAMPDERIVFPPQYTSLRGWEIVQKALRPGLPSAEVSALIADFDKEGPSAEFYSSRNMSYKITYTMEWDHASDSWFVRVQPAMINPRRRAFSYLGISVRPDSLTPKARVVPLSEWAVTHPAAVRNVLPQLALHRQHDAMLRARLAEAERGEKAQ